MSVSQGPRRVAVRLVARVNDHEMLTHVTDAGLRHLTGLSELRRLDLGDTAVADAGLRHLTGLSELRRLDLSRTEVTAEARRRFVEAGVSCP